MVNIEYLLVWVEEYGIEQRIVDTINEDGYDAAVDLVYTYIDDRSYCEQIVSHFYE